jgi:membrane dipeptidase
MTVGVGVALVLFLGAGAGARAGAVASGPGIRADMHSHPSRFHRANVARIEPEEIARYRRAGIDVVVASISSDTPYRGGYVERDGTEVRTQQLHPHPGEPWAYTLDRFARIEETVRSGDAVLATTPAEALSAKRAGKLALIAALEGADGLEGSLARLTELHGRGLELIQLVHFRANEIGHIQTWPYSPGGLTEFGRAVVRESNRLGIIIDLAHANPETIRDVLAASTRPVIFSHTGALALHQGDRDLGDDEIRAIAAKGGVIGIWPNGEEVPTVEDMVRHITYVRDLVGIDHVGIGSDLRGMSSYSEGFGEDAHFEAIEAALHEAGYSEEDVARVMGDNFVRVWTEVTK